MMADELLNAQDLITAKKHDTFHSEVITGKTGGLSTGADIDYATNAVTGQVQKTLPKILDDLDWSYVGLFADGVTFTKRSDFAVDSVGIQWVYAGAYPFTATAGTVPTSPDYQAVHVGDHASLSGLNPDDGSAHNANDISNQSGGTLKDTADFVELIKQAEVVDYNYSQPYRLESDYTPSVVYGVAQTGQSLAGGGVGGDFVSGVSTVAFEGRTLMFSPQPMGLASQVLSNVTTGLTEPARVTIGHSLTRSLATGNENTYLFSGQQWGGQAYIDIKKGGSTGVYEAVITQVGNAAGEFPNITYLGVTNIHGEQDGLNNNTGYAANLNEWQVDFDADIKSVTGQTENVPMYICQTSTAGGYGFNGGINELTFPTPLQQLLAHETYGNVVLVCPKYNLAYYDHSHIKNISQRILGEYYHKAMSVGAPYEPLRPLSFVVSGSSVVITFSKSSLALDTTLVQSIANSGFSYTDDSSRTITGVSITATNEVTITLSGTVGTNAVVAYAYHNGSGGATNQAAGLGDRGNLRDNDSAVSLYNGAPLYNWCVTFRKGIN